ncbi:MAG: helix-turn-helix domain-containing protein [Saprospiraceae bacterium]|nr:helix-turn-helix domain-containing protein [Saprospiraceae bacterium]
MIAMEDWVTIKNLKSKGKSIRGIAQLLNISRNTVRTVLRTEEAPGYKREQVLNPDIVPFSDYII